jgi:hypothetical protein
MSIWHLLLHTCGALFLMALCFIGLTFLTYLMMNKWRDK